MKEKESLLEEKIQLPAQLQPVERKFVAKLEPWNIKVDEETEGRFDKDNKNIEFKKAICEGLKDYQNKEKFVDFLQKKVSQNQNRSWSVGFDVADQNV